jgi:hypothetical protein
MHTIKNIFSKYGGMIIGSVYGLTMRIIFGHPFKIPDFDFSGLFSITFIWIVPVIIGIAPMMFATKEQLASNTFRITRPVVTVLLFFLLAFSTGLEDIVCIVIIAFPFLLTAAVSGYIFAKIMQHRKNNKGMMYSLLLIPFLSGFIEEKFPTPSQTYNVSNVVIVNATPDVIWKNIVRVKEINESEYEKGFFNYAGIPRPLYAELDKDTIGATRVGHFEGGLTFHETVIAWEKNKHVAFNITVIPSTIRQTIFDQHVLKGRHFAFLDASYTLEQVGENQTKLTLSSTYRLDTRINNYSAIWGRVLLSDFQERLLVVIKNRCDEQQ